MHYSMTRKERFWARFLMYSAAIAARAGLLAICLFIFSGPFNIVGMQLTPIGGLVWDAMLSALFFLQHSGMVRRSHRAAMAKLFPEYAHSAIYALVSGIVLVAVVLLWQPGPTMLIELHGLGRWVARGFFFLAVAGMAWGASALNAFDPYGVRPIKSRLSGTPLPTAPFSLGGPYLWVRHPLYFFVLVMLWSCPDLSTDRVLFNLLWSIWIFIGTVLEEKDLVSDFGDDYRRYQQQVPMLIPWKIPKIHQPP
jgi:protein-S-isoprenylcysteine O-methyltransferase Ste14